MIQTVAQELILANNIVLIAHINPDADGLGSMLALGMALRILGKNVAFICQDPVPKVFQFLPKSEEIKQDCWWDDFDLIVTLDCGDLKMTGFIDQLKSIAAVKHSIINIDHHHRSDLQKIAKFNYIVENAPSTAGLVLDLIDTLGVKIDNRIATNLLAGIYNDTGGFKHANTNPAVLSQAARLLSAGGRLKLIDRNVVHPKTTATLRLWGIVLTRLRFKNASGLASAVITGQDFLDCKSQASTLAGCMNLFLHIPKAKIALMAYQLDQATIKINLKTELAQTDVAKIARFFGGGGLKKSAAFTIKGSLILKDNQWFII